MTRLHRLRAPSEEAASSGPLKLTFIPVREEGASRSSGRNRGGLRVYLILWGDGKAPLSGGYTMTSAPAV